jgi:hypothetical protein
VVQRRTLVASDYNAKDRAHFALSYEFCRVVAECEGAELVAPDLDNYLEKYLDIALRDYDRTNVQRDFNRVVNGIRKMVGLRNAPVIKPINLDQSYDLFFFVAWNPQSFVELKRIRGWRRRCKTAVAYIFELWSSTLEADRPYLKILDQFDHVFVLHSASIPRLAAYTSAPCSFLPTAVDCLIATPYPSEPARVFDVYSMGNRVTQIHRRLVALAEQRSLLYLYDSLSSTNSEVKDWRDHRLLIANFKRTRYFIGFSPAKVATSSNAKKVAGEEIVASRFFEGAAGGAVILGSAPQCPEFGQCFDWPDAVVEVPPDVSDIATVIEELEDQPWRVKRIGRTNAIRCLLRHDWVYRWETILSTIGMESSPQLHERKARLGAIAAAATVANRDRDLVKLA